MNVCRQLFDRHLIANSSEKDSYWLIRIFFIRGLGLLYLNAFFIFLGQGEGLVGKNGLLPVAEYIRATEMQYGSKLSAFCNLPSLFYLNSSDSMLLGVGVFGVLLSLVLVAGRCNFFILLALWLFQQSLVNSGQLFYNSGYQTGLLELTFLSFFLCPLWQTRLDDLSCPPKKVAILALRWMAARHVLGEGLIKLRLGECWSDFTCLSYHYQNQPVPHPLSWFFHQLPTGIHQLGVAVNHVAELIIPFGFFGLAKVRRCAGILFLLFQIAIISTGNYAWVNWITIVSIIPCFDDEFCNSLSQRIGLLCRTFPAARIENIHRWVAAVFSLAIILLSVKPVMNLFSKNQSIIESYDPFHLVNSYGAFGDIRKERLEIIIKGTSDTTVSESTVWQEYGFKCKPGDVTRAPCFITPYFFHLDWQMWFSTIEHRSVREPWLYRFIARLLENDRSVVKLLDRSPFGESPPHFIRMDLYRYEFASWREWPKAWWKREFVQTYLEPTSLTDDKMKEYIKVD